MENTNIQLEDCLQTVNNIGSRDIVNICNDTVSTVPWGVIDWISHIGMIMVITAFVALVVAGVIGLIKMIFD